MDVRLERVGRGGTPVAIVMLAGLLLGCQGSQPVVRPLVPDLKGTYIAHAADIQADQKAMDEIVAVFKRMEDAMQRRDLETVMESYSKNYSHRGITKDTLRAEWNNLFTVYHDFSSTHVFSSIKVDGKTTPPTAQIVCTGSLWAISNTSGERINIDSWMGEMHNLVYEDGAWRIQGHAWDDMNPKTPRGERPPHPFF